MIDEFIHSIMISVGIPTAVFFSVKLHVGSFSKSNYSDDYNIDRIVIDKHALLGLIIALLDIVAGVIKF